MEFAHHTGQQVTKSLTYTERAGTSKISYNPHCTLTYIRTTQLRIMRESCGNNVRIVGELVELVPV
jgi:hypothetical protein